MSIFKDTDEIAIIKLPLATYKGMIRENILSYDGDGHELVRVGPNKKDHSFTPWETQKRLDAIESIVKEIRDKINKT